jgi:putative hydrolase of the HAD superfamily
MDIKAIIFDADGVVINSPGYFSVQYEKEFGVSNESMLSFFKGIFQEAVVGKADLKELLQPVLKDWQWRGTVDELLKWWFRAEHHVDEGIVKEIRLLQKKGVKCCLGTKQEKYRAEYIRKDMGFEKIFDELYISCDMGCKKPEEKFFRIIQDDLAEKYSVRPEEIMFWDNKEENIAASKKLGWQSHLYDGFDNFQKIISKV